MNDERWPVWKLSVLLYPFAAGAVAINLYMLLLMAQVFGYQPISPSSALVWGIILGVPAAWGSGKWARHLIDEAES